MSFKKKRKPLSYDEQQFVKKLLEGSKEKKKTLKGYVILKKNGSMHDVKMSGYFKDVDELNAYANALKDELHKIDEKWCISEIATIENNSVYEDDANG